MDRELSKLSQSLQTIWAELKALYQDQTLTFLDTGNAEEFTDYRHDYGALMKKIIYLHNLQWNEDLTRVNNADEIDYMTQPAYYMPIISNVQDGKPLHECLYILVSSKREGYGYKHILLQHNPSFQKFDPILANFQNR